MIFIRYDGALKFTRDELKSVPSLQSNQEETVSRVIFYSLFAASSGYSHVKVKTPDSGLFWILLQHSRKIDVPVFRYRSW